MCGFIDVIVPLACRDPILAQTSLRQAWPTGNELARDRRFHNSSSVEGLGPSILSNSRIISLLAASPSRKDPGARSVLIGQPSPCPSLELGVELARRGPEQGATGSPGTWSGISEEGIMGVWLSKTVRVSHTQTQKCLKFHIRV